MGRHDITAVAVGTCVILRGGCALPDREVSHLETAMEEAWRTCARRAPPATLHEHMAEAPCLAQRLAHARVVDVLPDLTPVPEPRVDAHGNRVHTLVHQNEVVSQLYSGQCAALIWNTTPAFAMVQGHGVVFAICDSRCGSLPSPREATALLNKLMPSKNEVMECTIIPHHG